MKKLLFTILMMLPILANAYDFKIGDIYYNYINNGKEVEVTYNEYLQNSYPLYDGIEISSEVTYGGKTLKVTAIGGYAFYNCSRLKSISIPNSVTIIGNNAFACSGLQSVSIPNSVTDINKAAFCECNSLKKISIGSGVKTIYSFAFADCPNLTEVYCYAVNVPKMLDYMYLNSCTNAFQNSNIGNATLHVPAESVSAYKNKEPWNGFKSIVSLSGQGGGDGGEQTTTGFYAKNADGVIIYYNYINNGKELEVTSNPNGKYSGVVRIPEKVTYSGNTRSVTRIGTDAFRGCTGLTSIAIPSSVTIIGTDAFTGCNSLTSVHISDLSAWCRTTIKGCNPLIYAHHLYLNNQKVTELVIPNDVTILKDYVFVQCTDLTSVSISSSVTRIEESVFYGCSNLSSITIPNSVTGIWDYAFGGCSSLKDVYCHAEVVPSTNPTAFSGTPINEATLHVPQASVSAYKSKSPWNGFKEIVAIGGNNNEGGETETGFYAKNADGVNIYYNYINGGNELEVTYKSAGYATYSGVVNIPESVTYNGKTMKVTSIGDLAFFECLNLTTISIPSSMTNISLTAFLDCLNLKNVTINSNSLMSKDCNDFVNMPLTTIFDKAEQLVIGDDVKSLGRQVFFGSSYLKSVTIGSGVTNMAEDAFGDCLFITSLTINSNNIVSKNYTDNTSLIKVFGRGLNSIKIGEKVTSIGNYAFYDCANLLTLTLPNTITSIGDNAFSNCTFLTSLSIPNSVKSIGEYAFYGCTSMSSLSLGNSLENIGKCTFYGGVKITEIYSSAANPPACDSSVFAGVNTESCIVYVPTGSSESYKNSEEWRDFKNIKESAALGISQKNVEEAVAVGIYDMGGHRQSGLQRGVNIIRMSNGKTKKILVK